jgi:hypothetical protein
VFRRDEELARLRDELVAETYEPGGLDVFTIRDPKPRLIARAPLRDRILQSAIVMLLEPFFLRSATRDTFACRPGFGTHAAVLRLLALMRRHRYALHLDIRSYFPSIDPVIVMRLLGERVRDDRLIALIARIVAVGRRLYESAETRRGAGLDADWPPAGRGLAVGSALSQLVAAHVFLAGFDHFVKRDLRVSGYVRYMDDLFLFAPSRRELRRWREQAALWLWAERGLRLEHPAAPVLSCTGHLDALGFVVRRQGIEPRQRAFRRMERDVRRALRDGDTRRLGRSLSSRAGHLFFG